MATAGTWSALCVCVAFLLYTSSGIRKNAYQHPVVVIFSYAEEAL